MAQKLSDLIQRNSFCIEIAGYSLSDLVAALPDMASTFSILFKHIGYLSCCDPLTIACEHISFAITSFRDLVEKDYGLGNKWHKSVFVSFGMRSTT